LKKINKTYREKKKEKINKKNEVLRKIINIWIVFLSLSAICAVIAALNYYYFNNVRLNQISIGLLVLIAVLSIISPLRTYFLVREIPAL